MFTIDVIENSVRVSLKGLKMIRSRWVHLMGVLAVYCLLSFSTPQVSAQISKNKIKNSTWQGYYETKGGNRMNCKVVLNGSSGTYHTSDGSGRLRNVEYNFDNDPSNGDWFVRISADWYLTQNWGGKYGGEVSWTTSSDNYKNLSGDYDINGNRGGAWNCRLQSFNGGNDDFDLGGGGGGMDKCVDYSDWKYNDRKCYYYRTCQFPGGGYQYVIYYPDTDPEWVFWYNPKSEKYWCSCPTVKHPKYGKKVRNGHEYFHRCSQPAREIEDCEWEDEITTSCTAKNDRGESIDLAGLPTDLP